MKTTLSVSIFVLLAGCDSSGTESGTDTSARGSAVYRDALTDTGGAPRDPARPDPQAAEIQIEIAGTGTMSGPDPDCALDGATGSFEGAYDGEAVIDEDGIYFGALASSGAEFFTPGGCPIGELEIAALTDVVVRVQLEMSEPNCDGFCAAHARSSGEAECATDDASCRAAAESQAAASCQVACSTENHSIVAETQLSAAAAAELTASSLTGTALGELEADLVFDRIVDADGRIVAESP